MKKFLGLKFVLVLVAITLFACGPASAPPTDTNVVQVPASAPGQLTGTMVVKFEVDDILPAGAVYGDFPVIKSLNFKKMGEDWKEQTGTYWSKEGVTYPKFESVDMGELFKVGWSQPMFSANSGRVNAYFGEPEGGISFMPLDETINEEVAITIRLTYSGCERDSENWIVCEKFASDGSGSLKYWLNPEKDSFIFVMKENYNRDYVVWMIDSLTKLGFTNVADQIPEDIIPGEGKTIVK